MGKTFLAFAGPALKQKNLRQKLASGMQCWDLKKMSFAQFIDEIKKEIPPINANVTDEYYVHGFGRKSDMEKIYEKCSWGLLISIPEQRSWGYDEEIIFLLNLYSPDFLYPLLTANDLGLEDLTYIFEEVLHDKLWTLKLWNQNKASLFKSRKFSKFLKEMENVSSLFQWVADRVTKWKLEEVRIWMACLLFNELKQYDGSKRGFVSHKEYLDLCVILETLLFTTRERARTNRFVNRSALLLKTKHSTIAQKMEKLYEERSNFVHGKTFKEFIHKNPKEQYAQPPSPDFDFTKEITGYVREIIVVYAYIYSKRRADPILSQLPDVISAIKSPEYRVRLRVKKLAKEILSTLP